GFHNIFGTSSRFAVIALFMDARLGTRPNTCQVGAALTFFTNLMTQGAGPLAIKNVLACLDKILGRRIRRQDEFLGRILTQLRDTVPHPQKEGNDQHIKRKHLQECLHAPASLVLRTAITAPVWRGESSCLCVRSRSDNWALRTCT